MARCRLLSCRLIKVKHRDRHRLILILIDLVRLSMVPILFLKDRLPVSRLFTLRIKIKIKIRDLTRDLDLNPRKHSPRLQDSLFSWDPDLRIF